MTCPPTPCPPCRAMDAGCLTDLTHPRCSRCGLETTSGDVCAACWSALADEEVPGVSTTQERALAVDAQHLIDLRETASRLAGGVADVDTAREYRAAFTAYESACASFRDTYVPHARGVWAAGGEVFAVVPGVELVLVRGDGS